MVKKIVWVLGICLLLVACGSKTAPVEEPTLDATHLNQTAVSLVTLDYAETQTRIPTETPILTLTHTPIPTMDRTRPPIQTPTSELPCNMAAAGQPFDITIPDDTKMAPSAAFSKTWRLKNVGACTWTRQYALTFFSGNSLGAQYSHFLKQPVNPGEMIDITVDMVAPESIGIYQSNWMLSDPEGALFGIGPHGDAPFWVRIEVVQMVTDTPQPTPTFTPTPVVYVTGEAELQDGDELDLDAATLNPDEEDKVDLLYQFGGTPAYLLTPINDMVWVAFGESEPSFSDCADAELSDDAIDFDEVPTETYYCYQTSGGLPGWFFIDGFDNGTLSVSFLTWAAP